ncbi:MAG: hypothetical protein HFG20_10810 [Anaerotruncus sp.]|nr:hypothetical protein [Anaerotruncus sp.]
MCNIILWFLLAVLACVGFVQVVSWIAVHSAWKGNRVYRVIPVGKDTENLEQQLALVYASLQWESNPSRQKYILYNIGLHQRGIEDCCALARDTGIQFANSPEELLKILQ